MANKKISELDPISNSQILGEDVLPIVDISDAETKKIAISELDLRWASATDTALSLANKAPSSHVGSVGVSEHGVATPSLAGFMSDLDKTKLNGIESGSTSNQTDTYLLDRANHTGTQPASTIADGSVSDFEFQYLDGVTGPIQNQINAITSSNTEDVTITDTPTINLIITGQNLQAVVNLSDTTIVVDALGIKVGIVPVAQVSGLAAVATSGLASDIGLGNVNNTSDIDKPISSATQSALDLKESLSNKNIANGYAGLDGGGKISATFLPNSIMELQGNWNANINSPTLIDGTGNPGDVWNVTVAGTVNFGSGNISFAVGDFAIYGASGIWFKSLNSNAVITVNGLVGSVNLVASNIPNAPSGNLISTNLQNAVNELDSQKEPSITPTTSDDIYQGNKTFTPKLGLPISTSTQTALDLKAPLVSPSLTGVPIAPTAAPLSNTNQIATTAFVGNAIAAATVPDATASTKGKVRLAGDLGGTADLPTVPGLADKEPTVIATTAADYYRGDKTFQTLNKSAVNLSSVDNTSDLDKPISSATQTALNLKYDASNPNGYETPTQLNVRDTANRARTNHTGTQLASTISDFSSAADARIATQKGVAFGLAPLGSDSLISSIYLPSYVDDIVEVANYASLPSVGESGKIYVTLAAGSGYPANMQYRWSGSAYQPVVSSPGTTDNVIEGVTNLYFTLSRVLNTVLTGFASSNAVIAASDTVLSALGKAQGQISNIISTFAATVRSTVISGFTSTNSAVSAADTVEGAIGKLQGQVSANITAIDARSLKITTKDEGVDLTTAMDSINFVGTGVTATNVGNAVTVTINSVGDVIGPAASTDSEIAVYNGTTGKIIKRATGTGFAKLISGVLSSSLTVAAATEISGILPILNGGTNKSSWSAGSIVFAGAGGSALAESTGFLFSWDSVNNRFNIGAAGGGKVNITNSGGTDLGLSIYSTAANNAAQIQNQSAYTLALLNASASATAGASIGGAFSRGTLGARTQSLAGDQLFSLTAQGYTGTAFGPGLSGAISFVATENTTATANGSSLVFSTTPNATITPVSRMSIGQSGIVNISNLTASLPVQTDASKNLISSAINLASSQVSGILPEVNGGTGSTQNYTPMFTNFSSVFNTADGIELTVRSHNIFHNSTNAHQADGNVIRFYASGTIGAGVSATKRIRVYYGASAIYNSGTIPSSSAGSWYLEGYIMRTGTNLQKTMTKLSCSQGIVFNDSQYSTATEPTASGASTFRIALTGSNVDTLSIEMSKVTREP